MQLEALALAYPTLRIRARSSTSLPYLAMDQANLHIGQHLSESMSSGSSGSNSYSNSSSGDGLVTGPGRGGCDTLHRQLLLQDEEYEDFQDNKRNSGIIEERSERSREDADEKEDAEDVYMEAVEAMPFSSIIATCDRHGVLIKKTKGLLRNVKSYHCVAANGMLYLYLKEADERQRKTIDLTGYSARPATGEDIRDQRKRDAAFEIVGPGKKTHTFIARTARDKMDWLAAIDHSIKYGRIRIQSSSSSVAEAVAYNNTSGDTFKGGTELILPPKAPLPLQIIHRKDDKPADEYFYYHDVASDVRDEVYEEVDPEGMVVGNIETLPPPPPPLSQPPDYDPIYPDDFPQPPSLTPLPSTPSLRRPPPGRPPLPDVLQDRLNKQAVRPLPDAPPEPNEGDDPIGIYCEIEEDIVEIGRENLMKTLEAQKDSSKMEGVNSNSDTEISVFSDGLHHQKTTEMPSINSRSSSNSLVGFLSDEIFMNISEFSPSHHLQKYPLRSSNPITPPKLPPKGIPIPSVVDDDSEYKVPCIVPNIDAEYQIPPSNPIPTDAEEIAEPETVHEISGPIPTASQMYQVPPSQTIVSIKPNVNERKNSIIEECSRPMSSFLSGQEDPYPKSTLKALTKRFEKIEDIQARDGTREIQQSCQGTSVKDIIARINKNKTIAEKDDHLKSREEPVCSAVTANDKEDDMPPKSNLPIENTIPATVSEQKLIKPVLPPRPHNLINGTTITQKSMPPIEEIKSSNSTLENGDASDDDHYETPDDNSFEGNHQQDSQGEDAIAPWRTVPETTGDWYVAKFAFVATIDQALSFNRGDVILIHDTSGNSGWWKATHKGRSGLVPREYLKKKD
ncbi:uncharacterized protein [Procambarus clarkii]|uniref:uncharacterized protein isoform X2 n=1 Tax=Procambarus clarkii TaxID=6728 RepID=UPI0037447707